MILFKDILIVNYYMVKIAFHDNQLCERGTTVSLYDYAYYNKHYLGNESIEEAIEVSGSSPRMTIVNSR